MKVGKLDIDLDRITQKMIFKKLVQEN